MSSSKVFFIQLSNPLGTLWEYFLELDSLLISIQIAWWVVTVSVVVTNLLSYSSA